jgi:small subunit ribosomal protein S1
MTSSTQANSTPKVAVNDIGSEEAFLAAIDETIKYFNDGDIVEGTVVKVDRDEVLLDIGYKTEGVIPSRELSIKHDVDPHEVVKTGEHIEALVLQKEDKEGRLILSKKRAQYERAWGTIEKIKEEDGVVTGTVIEVVKGGLILDIGLRGFLPASLVEMRRVRDLQPYVGREIEAKIIELDKNRNNVVLSRRAWLEQTQSEVRHTFLNTLTKGQIRKGVVSSIVNFGAFVDLGGVDGLVHVSELSWKHIDHPGEVVEVGQEVTVEVLDVDMDRERVSLSLKSTQEDPWQQFARTHQIGQVVPGRVTKLVPFGAFVRVEEGIEGLVHISELADRHVEIPEQVVQVGDEIFVKIIDIDLDRRRISLSLKQANEGTIGEAVGEDFDPTLYGMPASYDDQGNYQYPEGFDPETAEWLPGYEKQREEWEHQYAEARARFEAHRKQVEESRKADEEAALAAVAAGDDGSAADDGSGSGGRSRSRGGARGGSGAGTGSGGAVTSSSTPGAEPSGTLASDEALAALREKLSGGQS